MASEDSRQHFFQRAFPRLPLAGRVHLVRQAHDPSEAFRVKMLLAAHHLDDLTKPLERLNLAAERHDVPLEERNDALAQREGRGHLVHQDLGTSGLGIDVPACERALGELEDLPSALVWIQEESWIDVEPRATRRMCLDAHRETTFALDESR